MAANIGAILLLARLVDNNRGNVSTYSPVGDYRLRFDKRARLRRTSCAFNFGGAFSKRRAGAK